MSVVVSRLGHAATYRTLIRRRLAVLIGLAGAVLACFLADLVLGPTRYGITQVVEAVVTPSSVAPAVRLVVWDIRMPVALMAVVTGAALAIAGAQMQTILANPLASPFTLGISAAAGFGAALALVAGVTLVPFAPDYGVPLNAFVVAMGAALLIHALSRTRGATTETVILLGIALVFTFNALTALLQFFASDQALSAVVFWTMGSLARTTWHKLAVTSAALAVTLPFFLRRAWALTTLRLGDDKAASYGIDEPRRVFRRLQLLRGWSHDEANNPVFP